MSKIKSITPLPPADFTPDLGNFKTLQSFRYWCQKVLPLVYDNSLSYYELLCKVVDYLNKTMEDIITLHGDVTNLHKAYAELQSYVNNYFSSLDVQEEINNKLDELVNSGKLDVIFNQYIRYVTPEEFGAIGDGVNDDTNAIKQCLEQNKSILLTQNYLCSEPLTDNIGHIICGDGTIISEATGYILTININKGRTEQRKYSYNLRIKGNKLNYGVLILNSIGNLYNIKTQDVLIGLNIAANTAENGYNVFENIIDFQGEFNGGYGTYGVQCNRGDNVFNNIITINYETGLYNNGPTDVKYIHSWLGIDGANCWENSCVIREYSNVFGCSVGFLYADTMRFGVYFNDYANTSVNKYQLLINTSQLLPTWVENPHVVKIGKGSLSINQFHSYHPYSYYKFIKNVGDKYNLKIGQVIADPWINECSFIDICFNINITSTMNLYSQLPPRLTDKYVDGTIVCESLGNGRYYQLWYYNSTGIFYSVNDNPTTALWKFIETDYS